MPVTPERLEALIAKSAATLQREAYLSYPAAKDVHEALQELRTRRAQERALWIACAERWGDTVAERLERRAPAGGYLYDASWVWQAARSAAHFGRLALDWTETKGDDA